MPPMLSWPAIRPLNGDQRQGFEELCAQLARCETPPQARFVRTGAPDGGVECYAVFPNGDEWGWQAKYFLSSPGTHQWSDVADSVRTALEKHPRLVRYYVCMPVDLPDARLKGQKSARQQWDERVERWRTASRGWVEFIFWGAHELTDRLQKPAHAGRRWFFFDVARFDADWFKDRWETARRGAGDRYTPELNVDLPVALKLEAFGRTERFYGRLKAHAIPLRKALDGFAHGRRDPELAEAVEAAARAEEQVRQGLVALAELGMPPIGTTGIGPILHALKASASRLDELDTQLRALRYEGASGGQSTKLAELAYWLDKLQQEVENTREALEGGRVLAEGQLLTLVADQGMGKTHLLCDVTQYRLSEGRPTVLLLGQQFSRAGLPWLQALEQLDLAGRPAGEFIGALEAAAQAAGKRALLIVDALNESERTVWPETVASFVHDMVRSSWLGVVLSVRTPYEKRLLGPVKDEAVRVVHHGFGGQEHKAIPFFFKHYGIEVPSTPLLAPEFSNPLFLLIFCRALRKSSRIRLPRGALGFKIEVFGLYLDVINERLSKDNRLDFYEKRPLVRQALRAFAEACVQRGYRWLPALEGEALTNTFLPGRGHERSLFRGLISEGLLIEDLVWLSESHQEDVVRVVYESLVELLIAEFLLEDPEPARLLKQISSWPGLMEILCIQASEELGRELFEVVPELFDVWDAPRAFLRSLVWRRPTAITEQTGFWLNKAERHPVEMVDTLVTVATLPDNPYNAYFLHARLMQDSMADRDAWWSTTLHQVWQETTALRRLVQWAFTIRRSSAVDAEIRRLAATALVWCFSSSNRELRDRATKAVVCLVDGHLELVEVLLEQFAKVNDPYVSERLFAVAYGVAMRSHTASEVVSLAQRVFNQIFANGTPPAHVLLRDSARGVVERALYLGAEINGDVEYIQPHYGSPWPEIPTQEEVDRLRPSEGGRLVIHFSVMHGDFASYVIGTNHGIAPWLQRRLGEPRWTPPEERAKKQARLVASLPVHIQQAWTDFGTAGQEWSAARLRYAIEEALRRRILVRAGRRGRVKQRLPQELAATAKAVNRAWAELLSSLTEPEFRAFREFLLEDPPAREERTPYLDRSLLQRYIVKRVFDLGWTEERFGSFDRNQIGSNDRGDHRAERIGKKYQWIAYHEVMALLADNFQYRGDRSGDEEQDPVFPGAWQEYLRNIDPSCIWGLIDLPEVSWPSPPTIPWKDDLAPLAWIQDEGSTPAVPALLRLEGADGVRWCVVHGDYHWNQPTPPHQERWQSMRREAWIGLLGYLVRAGDVEAFMDWAPNVDFFGRWMPGAPEFYRLHQGEYGWGPAYRALAETEGYGASGWTRPERRDRPCPIDVCPVAARYVHERGNFDYSTKDGFSLLLPAEALIKGMGLRWSGEGADYLDADGRLVATQALVDGLNDMTALVVREDALLAFLVKEGLAMCWAVIGEKWHHPEGDHHTEPAPMRHLTGAYALRQGEPQGFLSIVPENDDLLDLNTASVDQLAQLPGVSRKLAAAIVEHRAAQGGFASVDDLARVKGIGPSKLAGLRSSVRV